MESQMNAKPVKIPARGAVLAVLPSLSESDPNGMAAADIRRCVEDALRGVRHDVVDLQSKGMLVHTLDTAVASAAMREIERMAVRLSLRAPTLRVFRLPEDRDVLHRALMDPGTLADDATPLDRRGLDEIMRGRDVDSYRVEQAIWRFGPEKTDVMGYRVAINLDALSLDLGLTSAAAGTWRADLERMAVERLIGSYAHGRPGHRHPQFIRVPRTLLATRALWAVLEAKPVAALDNLVVEIGAAADQAVSAECADVIGRLKHLGLATAVQGVDWSRGDAVEVPPATWVAGEVTASAGAEQLAAAVAKVGADRAIAVVDTDPASLERALAGRFIYGSGPAADSLARARRKQQLTAAASGQEEAPSAET